MKLRPLDKKGVEISMNTIIITIIVVLVLLIVVLSFTGGMRTMIEQIKRVFGTSTESPETLARDRCETLCTQIGYGLSRQPEYCAGVRILDQGGEYKCFDCKPLAPLCADIDCKKYTYTPCEETI